MRPISRGSAPLALVGCVLGLESDAMRSVVVVVGRFGDMVVLLEVAAGAAVAGRSVEGPARGREDAAVFGRTEASAVVVWIEEKDCMETMRFTGCLLAFGVGTSSNSGSDSDWSCLRRAEGRATAPDAGLECLSSNHESVHGLRSSIAIWLLLSKSQNWGAANSKFGSMLGTEATAFFGGRKVEAGRGEARGAGSREADATRRGVPSTLVFAFTGLLLTLSCECKPFKASGSGPGWTGEEEERCDATADEAKREGLKLACFRLRFDLPLGVIGCGEDIHWWLGEGVAATGAVVGRCNRHAWSLFSATPGLTSTFIGETHCLGGKGKSKIRRLKGN
ncbi:hypothetical protein BC830DRAFT_1113016 [Chytriomyces sp. MP71]|nr:hypothetical protein BC830DRAFT_1113016 [Chytriomyces sp. MP71]